jgi:hypothetical protein
MTIRDSSVRRARAGVVTDPIPDPQVPERSRGRRQFPAKYKARVFDEYDALDKAAKGAPAAPRGPVHVVDQRAARSTRQGRARSARPSCRSPDRGRA